MAHEQVYKVELTPKYIDENGFRVVDTFYTGYPSRDIGADRVQRIQQGRSPMNYSITAVESYDAADFDDDHPTVTG